MAITFRFIANPDEGEKVLSWFSELDEAPEVYPEARGALLYFRQFGRLIMASTNEVDRKASPLVSLFLPHVRREILWTVGEVHFLPDRMRSAFPRLHRVATSFGEWLQSFPLVFHFPRHPQAGGGQWDYYLEGSVRNFDLDIFALPR